MKAHAAVIIATVSSALLLWNASGRRCESVGLITRIAFVALALASFAVACGGARRETATAPYGSAGGWGIFHYYLGAKYFRELDYASFYACALAADLDGRRVWHANTRVRNLSSYAIVGRDDVAPCPNGRFSPARWRDFTGDVAVLQKIMPEGQREGVLTDKGFNPPPSWGVLAGWVANRLPLGNVTAAKIVFNLDLMFALISLIWIASSTLPGSPHSWPCRLSGIRRPGGTEQLCELPLCA